jgi:hypothetical protein
MSLLIKSNIWRLLFYFATRHISISGIFKMV